MTQVSPRPPGGTGRGVGTRALRLAAVAVSVMAIGCGSEAGDGPERAVTPATEAGSESGSPAGSPEGTPSAPASSPDLGADGPAQADSPVLARPEVGRYLARVNAACAADRGARHLSSPPPAGDDPAKLMRYARRTLPRVQRRYDRLASQEPPEEFREPMQAMLLAYQSYITLLQQLATQAGDGRAAPIVEQLRPAAERVRSQVALAGLPACA